MGLPHRSRQRETWSKRRRLIKEASANLERLKHVHRLRIDAGACIRHSFIHWQVLTKRQPCIPGYSGKQTIPESGLQGMCEEWRKTTGKDHASWWSSTGWSQPTDRRASLACCGGASPPRLFRLRSCRCDNGRTGGTQRNAETQGETRRGIRGQGWKGLWASVSIFILKALGSHRRVSGG